MLWTVVIRVCAIGRPHVMTVSVLNVVRDRCVARLLAMNVDIIRLHRVWSVNR